MRLGRGVEPARGGVGRHGRPAQAKRLSQGDEAFSLPRTSSSQSAPGQLGSTGQGGTVDNRKSIWAPARACSNDDWCSLQIRGAHGGGPGSAPAGFEPVPPTPGGAFGLSIPSATPFDSQVGSWQCCSRAVNPFGGVPHIADTVAQSGTNKSSRRFSLLGGWHG